MFDCLISEFYVCLEVATKLNKDQISHKLNLQLILTSIVCSHFGCGETSSEWNSYFKEDDLIALLSRQKNGQI